MIKCFALGTKFNVIDDNNNFVGFDTEDDCCDHGGFFISDKVEEKNWDELENKGVGDLPEYVFDTEFFQELPDEDGGGVAVFRLKGDWNYKEVKPLYLHLFNMHNGYYGKGFRYVFNDQVKEGRI